MSVSDTAAAPTVAPSAARRRSAPLVRDAVPADYPAIRRVILAAYRQYADLIARDIFLPYLADLLDLDKHARHGRLLVVEADGRIRGFGAFYPDASVQGFGWPAGWAAGHPSSTSTWPPATAGSAPRRSCRSPTCANWRPSAPRARNFPILEALMTTNARIRRVSSPAYYLARPAALWLAAFTPQPQSAPAPADGASCTSEVPGPAADRV